MWERTKWAGTSTAERAGTLTFQLWTLLFDAVAALLAYQLSAPPTHLRVFVAIGAVVIGTLATLTISFVTAYIFAPREVLFFKVASLEETVSGLQGQLSMLLEDKFGEPLRFLPVYETLRSDIRQSRRVIQRAINSGRLWNRAQAPDYKEWKKQKDAIATNPWAKIDNLHGILEEAFDHSERLVTSTSVRFIDRRTKDSDELPAALAALIAAEQELTHSIDRLTELQKGNGEEAA